MSIYQGVVRGNVVVLPTHVRLADGIVVEVRTSESSKPHPSEIAFKQKLLETGLLLESRTHRAMSPIGERALINVKGKPLSEVVIEERR